ncbi:MAG: V-type ATP synthase subunit D [Alkaliphilus sp.]|mgnify:CR=1 FL=1|nr:V-type ATP synthase subunit D [Alkaliphilus sp.]
MDVNVAPTKANLIRAKNLLDFSQKGFELLDKKRNVLIREVMSLMDKSKEIQSRIESIFEEAYQALHIVNVSMGVNNVEEIAISVPTVEEFDIQSKSVMGVELPTVKYKKRDIENYYGFFRTNPALDIAVTKFSEVKYFIYDLAKTENSVYKLAIEIKKTQKRANALEKIQIPKYREQVKFIEEALEEKEREDFFRLKRVKQRK